MTRFEKKCFVGSAALHALLATVFLFGSAFFSSNRKQVSLPVFTLAAIPTDKMISTGGSPKGAQNPAPAAALPPPPVEPPKIDPPKPEPVKPEVKPEPEKLKEIVKPKPVETKKEVVKTPPKEKGEMPAMKKDLTKKPPKEIVETKPMRPISTNVVQRSRAELAAARAAADAEAKRRVEFDKAQREYAKEMDDYNRRMQAFNSHLGGVIDGVGKNLTTKAVAVPIGDGGAAYVHYGSAIGEIYRRAVLSSHPEGDEDAVAMIRIVVARNGAVKNCEWIRKTGNSLYDKAMERAMKMVRTLPPFPEGSTDQERIFTLPLGFEAKRVST